MKLSKIIRVLLLASLASLFFGGCGRNDWKTTDRVEILSESKSPDGKYVATVFSCSGGGAAGYTYTNVNVRKVSDDFSQRDFLLGERLWNTFSDISVEWKDSTTLDVSYGWASDASSHKTQNGRTTPEKAGVKINYTMNESN